MTTPQHGAGEPLFERPARQTLEAMRGAMERRPAPVLTPQERSEAEEAARENRNCLYCGGLHAAPSGPACPRLATFKLDPDGKVIEGTFWPGTKWAKGRVILAEDAAEAEEASDGSE